jgi:formyltetrahydrofolate hydrolase
MIGQDSRRRCRRGCFGHILASQQYGEPPDGRFFMRVHFTVPPPGIEAGALERDFCWVAESFHMSWQLHDVESRVRTLIMVSRLGHCLNDLPLIPRRPPTPDLDEGPIIEQDVIRVNHGLSPERLTEAGRDVEAQVLTRAVTWHAEHRVLLNDDRTVVFHLWLSAFSTCSRWGSGRPARTPSGR